MNADSRNEPGLEAVSVPARRIRVGDLLDAHGATFGDVCVPEGSGAAVVEIEQVSADAMQFGLKSGLVVEFGLDSVVVVRRKPMLAPTREAERTHLAV